MRRLVSASLEGLGHSLVEARDGNGALEAARAEQPELVVLDVEMPGRSGIDVLRAIRSDPALAAAKVIVLTAGVQKTAQDAALAAGADVFMTKPFRPVELIDQVERLLGS